MRGSLGSKTMWELSQRYRKLCHSKDSDTLGFSEHLGTANFPRVLQCVDDAACQKRDQMLFQLQALSKPGFEANHPGSITLYAGDASFQGPHRLSVTQHVGFNALRPHD